MSVPMPAIIIAFCTRLEERPLSTPTTLARIIIGVTLATNIAKTCCRPKGMALERATLPSSE